MYMSQPPVYSPSPGSLAPADVQYYQTQPGAPANMTQTHGYNVPSSQNHSATADNLQTPYPEKALL